MKIKLHHTPYVSRKITRDLISCELVETRQEKNAICAQVEKILDEDIENELDLDEKVNVMLDKEEDDIEYYHANYKELFWMVKKRIASENNVILNSEDRISDISHKILDYLWEEDFIHYVCSDNQIKNIISASLDEFIAGFEEADSIVYEKLKNYKRKIIPGTEEYDLVYERLYEEELIRRGLA